MAVLARFLPVAGAVLLSGFVAAGAAVAAHGAPPAATSRSVTLPHAVKNVSLSADDPAMRLYVPIRPLQVTRELDAWLATSTPVAAPAMPTAKRPVVMMAYLGPARLYVTDASTGRRASVYPAYYLVDHGSNHTVTLRYFKDVVAYASNVTGSNGGAISYFRAPALYRYLRDDSAWRKQFRPMR